MNSVIKQVEDRYKKHDVVEVRSGDTVKVHQKIREGNKERVQVFQGLVIRTDRKKSHTSRITVRRVSSGVGVEKSFLVHSPLVVKIEVVKRSKVRRNYLSYMRERTGKSARLTGVDFDKNQVNTVQEKPVDEPEVPTAEAEPTTDESTAEAKPEKATPADDDSAK
jgi:large subunit ribosomal protein L19